jgi:hypothetical protein
MSDDPILTLSDALVEWINAGGYDQAFEAQRVWSPTIARNALAGVKVLVHPAAAAESMLTRAADQQDLDVAVVVLAPVERRTDVADPLDKYDLDPLLLLVRQLKRRLARVVLGGYSRYATLNSPIYNPAHLLDLRQFTSILLVRFRGSETVA